jgi:ClpX C4-type zinc finger
MTIPVCSFCKRPGPKVSYLVQGPDNLLICDNCVAASLDTVAKKDRGWRDRQIDHLLSLRNAEGPKTT